MAAAEIVFEAPDGHLTALLLDGVMSETHRVGALATEDEVEEGVDITDHYREERVPLDLVVWISDTPLDRIPGPGGDVTSFPVEGETETVDLGNGVSAQMWTPRGDITRTADSWALLQAAPANAWIATVTTKLATYDSMVLITGEAIRTREKGTVLEVALSFIPIRKVSTGRVDGAPPPRPARARNVAAADDGAQPGTNLNDEQRRSLALQGFQGVGVLN